MAQQEIQVLVVKVEQLVEQVGQDLKVKLDLLVTLVHKVELVEPELRDGLVQLVPKDGPGLLVHKVEPVALVLLVHRVKVVQLEAQVHLDKQEELEQLVHRVAQEPQVIKIFGFFFVIKDYSCHESN